jgi:5-methylthioadenosine/S-adenosylhomocysteine deaminase
MSEYPDATSGIAGTSRRGFLKSGVGLVAGSAAAQALPGGAIAQGAGDAELVRLQVARRILIKGAVVLTVDPQVGDFAKADILIEDGKIREIRPDIAASGDIVFVSSAKVWSQKAAACG